MKVKSMKVSHQKAIIILRMTIKEAEYLEDTLGGPGLPPPGLEEVIPALHEAIRDAKGGE